MPPGRPRPAAPAVSTVAAALLLSTLTLLSGLLAGQAGAAAPGPAATRAADDPPGGRALDTSGVVQAQGTTPLPEGLTGAAFVVADLDTGDVLAARDPYGRYGPASTIKTLTALALIPVLDPAAVYTPTATDVDLPLDSSRVGVVAGVPYPVRELFEGLLLMSGNDAANALASAAGGTERTLALMAAEAERVQARDTVARTPHGLDAEGQVSSAYDLALIARAAMQQPDFAEYVATKTSSMAAPDGQRFEIGSKNRLLWNYEGALGIKNGYTQAQRASFVGAAERDGRRLVVTVMRAEPAVWKETANLLDWGFTQPRTVRPVGELVEPLRPAATAFGQPVPAPPSAQPGASGTQSTLISGEQSLLTDRAAPDDGASWSGRLGAAALVLLGTVAGLRVRAVRRRRRALAARTRVRPGAGPPRDPHDRGPRPVPRRLAGDGPPIARQPARRASARVAERAPAGPAAPRARRVG
jgi:D-alanyl-D-alanine carboxypeptidase (penicillin-binding protein 5/6)